MAQDTAIYNLTNSIKFLIMLPVTKLEKSGANAGSASGTAGTGGTSGAGAPGAGGAPGTGSPPGGAANEAVQQPIIFGPGLGLEEGEVRSMLESLKDQNYVKTQLSQMKDNISKGIGPLDRAQLGRLLIYYTADKLHKDPSKDPAKFSQMLLAMTTGEDYKFSASEIERVFNQNRDDLRTLFGDRVIQMQGGLWNTFLNFWDDLSTPQKVALAIGIPLGLLSVTSAFFQGPNFLNILGLAVAGAGAAYGLSPYVRNIVHGMFGIGDATKLKTKAALASMLRSLLAKPSANSIDPRWQDCYRENIPIQELPQISADRSKILNTLASQVPETLRDKFQDPAQLSNIIYSMSPIESATTLLQILRNPNIAATMRATYGVDPSQLSDVELIGILSSVLDELQGVRR